MDDLQKETQRKLDHDLLVTLNTKFDLFMDEFRRISNGEGFPRCVQRSQRITELEKDINGKAWREEITEIEQRLMPMIESVAQKVDSLASTVKWLRNTFFGGSAIFALAGLVWGIVQLIVKIGG
jgi:hypothetical protein